MANLICLHNTNSTNINQIIWLNTDAIISIVDMRPIRKYTLITTFAGAPLKYHVKETGPTIVNLIKESKGGINNDNCKSFD